MSLSCEYVYIQKIYIYSQLYITTALEIFFPSFLSKVFPKDFISSRATFPPFHEANENNFHQAPNRAFQVALVLENLSANAGDGRDVGLIPVFDPCVRGVP